MRLGISGVDRLRPYRGDLLDTDRQHQRGKQDGAPTAKASAAIGPADNRRANDQADQQAHDTQDGRQGDQSIDRVHRPSVLVG